jgi:uncharacterized membrane protein
MPDIADSPFDDPAGRTRFAWVRTLLVVFVVSFLIERLYLGSSIWFFAVLAVPLIVITAIAVQRSRALRMINTRQVPAELTTVQIGTVLGSALFIAVAGLIGVFGEITS